jgi:hypothetical protein
MKDTTAFPRSESERFQGELGLRDESRALKEGFERGIEASIKMLENEYGKNNIELMVLQLRELVDTKHNPGGFEMTDFKKEAQNILTECNTYPRGKTHAELIESALIKADEDAFNRGRESMRDECVQVAFEQPQRLSPLDVAGVIRQIKA